MIRRGRKRLDQEAIAQAEWKALEEPLLALRPSRSDPGRGTSFERFGLGCERDPWVPRYSHEGLLHSPTGTGTPSASAEYEAMDPCGEGIAVLKEQGLTVVDRYV